jgi:hypothetical protein
MTSFAATCFLFPALSEPAAPIRFQGAHSNLFLAVELFCPNARSNSEAWLSFLLSSFVETSFNPHCTCCLRQSFAPNSCSRPTSPQTCAHFSSQTRALAPNPRFKPKTPSLLGNRPQKNKTRAAKPSSQNSQCARPEGPGQEITCSVYPGRPAIRWLCSLPDLRSALCKCSEYLPMLASRLTHLLMCFRTCPWHRWRSLIL